MKSETDAERSEARNFFEKYKKKGPKIHCLALKLYTGPPNCITGASKSGGRGGPGPPGPPLDPLVYIKPITVFTVFKLFTKSTPVLYFVFNLFKSNLGKLIINTVH